MGVHGLTAKTNAFTINLNNITFRVTCRSRFRVQAATDTESFRRNGAVAPSFGLDHRAGELDFGWRRRQSLRE